MSETTVHLESSRMLASGSRVLLKFEPDVVVRGAPPGAQGFGCFPGEIVGVRGRNGGGKLLAVKEVLMVSSAWRGRVSGGRSKLTRWRFGWLAAASTTGSGLH